MNVPNIDQDTAIQLCCLGIRHYYKDTNEASRERKQHLEYIEKEMGFSNFIPKSVIDTIKQKNLKKLIQNGYKKVYSFSELDYMMKFFELLGSQYTFDQESFVVTLGSGWNIPVDLKIGPHIGISYLTHPQANPTKVTDFQNIERITTCILPSSLNSKSSTASSTSSSTTKANNNNINNNNSSSNSNSNINNNNSSSGSSSSSNNKSKDNSNKRNNTCNCSEIKTQLRIKVTGNNEDLAITCKGIKTSESIADLVDGYCRLFNNNDYSLWDRSVPTNTKTTPSNSATNSLEKSTSSRNNNKMTGSTHSDFGSNGGGSGNNSTIGDGVNDQHPETSGELSGANSNNGKPILNEDYAELGCLPEEEGDYSTPAARNYELDRTQITLSTTIGVGQFGDVMLGTCRITSQKYSSPTQQSSINNKSATSISSDLTDLDDTQSNNSNEGESSNKNGLIQVAVKTCKADADLITSEKFLEEACK